MQPFLIPDDFRAFMQEVVRYLDTPSDEPKLLDGEDALQDETGYGGRVGGEGDFRFTYITPDGRYKWTVQLAEAAIRDISDGLLIEVMGERFDLVRTTHRQPKGHPLLIWGEHADDALVVRDRVELLAALDALQGLAQGAPRMLRLWSATDDQIVAMMWRDDCALYVIESLDGYATTCGEASRNDAFELVDYDGQAFAVPYRDCVPWPVARGGLLRFVEHGDLGPGIRTEGRIPTGLLMMGDADRGAVLEARAAPAHVLAHSSIPRMLAEVSAPQGEALLAWARRLVELLHARGLLELGPVSVEEIAYPLSDLLQAYGAEAERSLGTAEQLARELGAAPGVHRMFATGGDLQLALRAARAP